MTLRMPIIGECWRHYKGKLYTIVGMSTDDEGSAQVVYTPSVWTSVEIPPLFTQSLGRFVQEVEHDKPRFKFIYDGDDLHCPFITKPARVLTAERVGFYFGLQWAVNLRRLPEDYVVTLRSKMSEVAGTMPAGTVDRWPNNSNLREKS